MLIVLIAYYPIIDSIQISVTNLSIFTDEFIGLKNFVEYLSSPLFWNNLLVTVGMAIIQISGSFSIGFALALLLNMKFRGRGFVRSLLIVPWAVPGVAASLIFAWIYDYQFGALNYTLRQIGLIQKNVGWLTDPGVALFSVSIVGVWQLFPVAMTFILAGLQSVPESLYEAAKIDGAGRLLRFRHITLPSIRPVILMLLLFLTIFSWGGFVVGFMLTGGGPARSTENFQLAIYQNAFHYFQFGYAATIGVITLAIMLALGIIYLKYGEVKVY